MAPIRESIARLETKVDFIIEKLDTVEKLEERVDQLERKGLRTMAYVAGLSTAGGFFGGGALVALKDKIFALLGALAVLVLATGCVTGAAGCDVRGHWQQEAVLTIDRSMPPACILAAEHSYDFWSDVIENDYVRKEYRDHDWVGFHGLVPEGHIAIHYGKLSPGLAGLTESTRRLVDLSEITSSEITLAVCAAQTAAHELGHALGLRTAWGWGGHNPDYRYLMYTAASPSFLLTAEERSWVQRWAP